MTRVNMSIAEAVLLCNSLQEAIGTARNPATRQTLIKLEVEGGLGSTTIETGATDLTTIVAERRLVVDA